MFPSNVVSSSFGKFMNGMLLLNDKPTEQRLISAIAAMKKLSLYQTVAKQQAYSMKPILGILKDAMEHQKLDRK